MCTHPHGVSNGPKSKNVWPSTWLVVAVVVLLVLLVEVEVDADAVADDAVADVRCDFESAIIGNAETACNDSSRESTRDEM